MRSGRASPLHSDQAWSLKLCYWHELGSAIQVVRSESCPCQQRCPAHFLRSSLQFERVQLNVTAEDSPNVATFERVDFMESSYGHVDRLVGFEHLYAFVHAADQAARRER